MFGFSKGNNPLRKIISFFITKSDVLVWLKYYYIKNEKNILTNT